MKIILNASHGRLQAGKRSPWLGFDHPLREEIMKADRQSGPGWKLPEWWVSKKVVENIIYMLPKEINAIHLVPDTENRWQYLSGRIAKGNAMKADLWIGVHFDALGDGSSFNTAEGHHVFYASAKEEARLLNKYVELQFPKEKNRGIHHNPSPQYPVRFAELHSTNCKALISETFFYTNERQCELILNSIEEIANAHSNMIQEWVKLQS